MSGSHDTILRAYFDTLPDEHRATALTIAGRLAAHCLAAGGLTGDPRVKAMFAGTFQVLIDDLGLTPDEAMRLLDDSNVQQKLITAARRGGTQGVVAA